MADLDAIDDEVLLKKMWSEEQDSSERRRIRSRMFQLREKRLKELHNTKTSDSDLRSQQQRDARYRRAVMTHTSASDGPDNTKQTTATVTTQETGRTSHNGTATATRSGSIRKKYAQRSATADDKARGSTSPEARKSPVRKTRRAISTVETPGGQTGRPARNSTSPLRKQRIDIVNKPEGAHITIGDGQVVIDFSPDRRSKARRQVVMEYEGAQPDVKEIQNKLQELGLDALENIDIMLTGSQGGSSSERVVGAQHQQRTAVREFAAPAPAPGVLEPPEIISDADVEVADGEIIVTVEPGNPHHCRELAWSFSGTEKPSCSELRDKLGNFTFSDIANLDVILAGFGGRVVKQMEESREDDGGRTITRVTKVIQCGAMEHEPEAEPAVPVVQRPRRQEVNVGGGEVTIWIPDTVEGAARQYKLGYSGGVPDMEQVLCVLENSGPSGLDELLQDLGCKVRESEEPAVDGRPVRTVRADLPIDTDALPLTGDLGPNIQFTEGQVRVRFEPAEPKSEVREVMITYLGERPDVQNLTERLYSINPDDTFQMDEILMELGGEIVEDETVTDEDSDGRTVIRQRKVIKTQEIPACYSPTTPQVVEQIRPTDIEGIIEQDIDVNITDEEVTIKLCSEGKCQKELSFEIDDSAPHIKELEQKLEDTKLLTEGQIDFVLNSVMGHFGTTKCVAETKTSSQKNVAEKKSPTNTRRIPVSKRQTTSTKTTSTTVTQSSDKPFARVPSLRRPAPKDKDTNPPKHTIKTEVRRTVSGGLKTPPKQEPSTRKSTRDSPPKQTVSQDRIKKRMSDSAKPADHTSERTQETRIARLTRNTVQSKSTVRKPLERTPSKGRATPQTTEKTYRKKGAERRDSTTDSRPKVPVARRSLSRTNSEDSSTAKHTVNRKTDGKPSTRKSPPPASSRTEPSKKPDTTSGIPSSTRRPKTGLSTRPDSTARSDRPRPVDAVRPMRTSRTETEISDDSVTRMRRKAPLDTGLAELRLRRSFRNKTAPGKRQEPSEPEPEPEPQPTREVELVAPRRVSREPDRAAGEDTDDVTEDEERVQDVEEPDWRQEAPSSASATGSVEDLHTDTESATGEFIYCSSKENSPDRPLWAERNPPHLYHTSEAEGSEPVPMHRDKDMEGDEYPQSGREPTEEPATDDMDYRDAKKSQEMVAVKTRETSPECEHPRSPERERPESLESAPDECEETREQSPERAPVRPPGLETARAERVHEQVESHPESRRPQPEPLIRTDVQVEYGDVEDEPSIKSVRNKRSLFEQKMQAASTTTPSGLKSPRTPRKPTIWDNPMRTNEPTTPDVEIRRSVYTEDDDAPGELEDEESLDKHLKTGKTGSGLLDKLSFLTSGDDKKEMKTDGIPSPTVDTVTVMRAEIQTGDTVRSLRDDHVLPDDRKPSRNLSPFQKPDTTGRGRPLETSDGETEREDETDEHEEERPSYRPTTLSQSRGRTDRDWERPTRRPYNVPPEPGSEMVTKSILRKTRVERTDNAATGMLPSKKEAPPAAPFKSQVAEDSLVGTEQTQHEFETPREDHADLSRQGDELTSRESVRAPSPQKGETVSRRAQPTAEEQVPAGDRSIPVDEMADLPTLEKMLESAKDYDERFKLRTRIRALKKKQPVSRSSHPADKVSLSTITRPVSSVPKEEISTRPVDRLDTSRPREPDTSDTPACEERHRTVIETTTTTRTSESKRPETDSGRPRTEDRTPEAGSRFRIEERSSEVRRSAMRRQEERPVPETVRPAFRLNTNVTERHENGVREEEATRKVDTPAEARQRDRPASLRSLTSPRPASSTPVTSGSESITSSYGVGPTDDRGMPLFGLRALRKQHKQTDDTDSLESRTVTAEVSVTADTSGTPETVRRTQTTSMTSVISSGGRSSDQSEPALPLFGGLKALSARDKPEPARSSSPPMDSTDDGPVSTTSTPSGRPASFLQDRSKVTGIRDVLSRMDASNTGDEAELSAEDDQSARSLLNKFLGAQVLMTGMESMMAQAGSPAQVQTTRSLQRTTDGITAQQTTSSVRTGDGFEERTVTTSRVSGRTTHSDGKRAAPLSPFEKFRQLDSANAKMADRSPGSST